MDVMTVFNRCETSFSGPKHLLARNSIWVRPGRYNLKLHILNVGNGRSPDFRRLEHDKS